MIRFSIVLMLLSMNFLIHPLSSNAQGKGELHFGGKAGLKVGRMLYSTDNAVSPLVVGFEARVTGEVELDKGENLFHGSLGYSKIPRTEYAEFSGSEPQGEVVYFPAYYEAGIFQAQGMWYSWNWGGSAKGEPLVGPYWGVGLEPSLGKLSIELEAEEDVLDNSELPAKLEDNQFEIYVPIAVGYSMNLTDESWLYIEGSYGYGALRFLDKVSDMVDMDSAPPSLNEQMEEDLSLPLYLLDVRVGVRF